MSVQQAENYHREEIETFAGTAADMICAITMNYVEEAIGIARAAERARMPVALSFTVETDGRLPTGQTLRAAIEQVEDSTGGYPRYYMINCAHPTHFEGVLADDGRWLGRVRGLRANASRKSHAELNESTMLDIGDPIELGRDYARVKGRLRHLNVMGGLLRNRSSARRADCVRLSAVVWSGDLRVEHRCPDNVHKVCPNGCAPRPTLARVGSRGASTTIDSLDDEIHSVGEAVGRAAAPIRGGALNGMPFGAKDIMETRGISDRIRVANLPRTHRHR